MKRDDPYTRIQRQQLSTVGILIPLLTVVVIFQVFNPRNDFSIKVISLVSYIMLVVVGVYAVFRYKSNLKHLDQQRERALYGESSLLAREQPLPDPQILPLPTTIKLDQSRRAVVLLGSVIAF